LAVVLAVAGFSRRLVQRKFAAGKADERLRRAVLIETGGIVVLLAVAMALVQTAPPSAEAATTDARTGPGVVSGLAHMGMLVGPTAMVQVRISPSVVGINHLQVYAYSRAGAPLTVLSWASTAELPGRTPIVVTLTRTSGNHATGSPRLPWPGRWRLRISMTTAGAPPATVTGVIPVRPG
jgi:copper transport protein